METQPTSIVEIQKIRLFVGTIAVSLLLFFGASLIATQKQEVIVVDRPTVVAFFPPVNDAELTKNPDMNETLSDFQNYTRVTRERLEPLGIQFKEIYSTSFVLQVHGKTKRIRTKKAQVGYYFVAPDKSPRILEGVVAQDVILRIASDYFHLGREP